VVPGKKASSAGTLSGPSLGYPNNKMLDSIHCITQTNQNYATTFELQSSAPMEASKNITL
jgi:hypothetical protein